MAKNVGQLLACDWTILLSIAVVVLDRHETQGRVREGGKLLLRNQLAGDEAIISMEHSTGEIFGDQFSSEVKLPEHFVRAPAAQQLDDVSVDIGNKQSHDPSCTE